MAIEEETKVRKRSLPTPESSNASIAATIAFFIGTFVGGAAFATGLAHLGYTLITSHVSPSELAEDGSLMLGGGVVGLWGGLSWRHLYKNRERRDQ